MDQRPTTFAGARHSDTAQKVMSKHSGMTRSTTTTSEQSSLSVKPSYLFDVLTVFQASPLVWRHDKKEDLMPVDNPDFEKERKVLRKSLKEAEKVGAHIDLALETATTQALCALLETNHSAALHFSCHGYYSGLCFEDGAGGTHCVDADSLSALTVTAGGTLKFVFVSACFSRAVGEAFLKAGVKHVVCCHQDQELMDDAAIVFSENFYRALACGKNLQTAFERAQVALKTSPLISDPETEITKFLLLPEDANHHVDVFYSGVAPNHTIPYGINESLKSTCSIIPHPPDHFFGREVDIYNVLQSISRYRLVRVTGRNGIGKWSLAAAVCHYVNSRLRCFGIDKVIWLPLLTTSQDSALASALRRVFDMIQNTTLEVTLSSDCDFRRICGIIIEKLYQADSLLAIDARRIAGEFPMKKLSLFLDHVIRATKNVRVILLSSESSEKLWQRPCLEGKHEMSALGFRATALLFGTASPFVISRRHKKASTPQRLSNLLVQEEDELRKFDDMNLSKRSSQIFRLIGEGNPRKVIQVAESMEASKFDDLIALAEKEPFCPGCTSRAQLECQLRDYECQIEEAVAREDYTRASHLQDTCNETTRLLQELPSLAALRGQKTSLERKLKVILCKKHYKAAQQLKMELCDVEKKIAEEEKGSQESLEHYKASQQLKVEMELCDVETTIAEEEIGSRESLQAASISTSRSKERFDLSDAKEAHGPSDINPAATLPFPTRAELDSKIAKVEGDLKSAASQGFFARAKALRCELASLEDFRACLVTKGELEDELQSLKIAYKESLEKRNIEAAEILHKMIEELSLQISQEDSAEGRLRSNDPNKEFVKPGAFAVSGVDGRTNARRQQRLQEKDRDATYPIVADHVTGINDPQALGTHVPSAAAEEDTVFTDNRAWTWQGLGGAGEEEAIGLEDDASRSWAQTSFSRSLLEAHAILPIAAELVPAVSPNSNPIRLAADGHVLTEDEVEQLRAKHGWCPNCGVIRTHKKHWAGVLRPLNNENVRNGVCLQCNPSASSGGASASRLSPQHNSQTLSQSHREKKRNSKTNCRIKKGECPACGNKTHKVNVFTRKRTPLTIEGKCIYGTCLNCHPIEGDILAERGPTHLPPEAIEVSSMRGVSPDEDTYSMVSGITMEPDLWRGPAPDLEGSRRGNRLGAGMDHMNEGAFEDGTSMGDLSEEGADLKLGRNVDNNDAVSDDGLQDGSATESSQSGQTLK